VGGPLAIFRFLRREIPIIEVDPAGAARPLTVDNQRRIHNPGMKMEWAR
jgi:hypothetical protein